MSERRQAIYVIDPPAGARLRHYVAAMLLVGCALGSAVRALDRAAMPDAPSETQDAMLVDLPPAEAGAHPQGDDAPTQAAAAAANGAMTPPKPEDQAEPPKPAIVDIPRVPPPRQQSAPTSAPREVHETGGSPDARATTNDADDAETHRASAHLITRWQKALLARLQTARHGLPHHHHAAGLAKVAFVIDRDGHLVSERIAQSSGSSALDTAALTLVRLAAPYPVPPREADAAQLSFVVPVSFKP